MTDAALPQRLAGKTVLLIVGGGIAAYKTLPLIRLLRAEGCSVSTILTKAGSAFVTPLSLQALTEQPVHMDLLSLTEESMMGHIQLSRAADLLVIAPATADLLARMSAGMADDLAATVLLATDKPVLAAPAMNVRMWQHQATQANIDTLTARGLTLVGPEEGPMACHEYGPGRMAEPETIRDAILSLLVPSSVSSNVPSSADTVPQDLRGHHALVTSGPTHEPLDPVRYLANRSSGRQGHAIAAALARRGARVTLVSGPVSIPDPQGVTTIHVETGRQMMAACESALPADIAVCVAAVADWHVEAAEQKLKKTGGTPHLTLLPNPDILATLSAPGPRRPALVIGFAAETEAVHQHARDKRLRKGCDWLLANDVSPNTGIMGGVDNAIRLITADGEEDWPRTSKTEVADHLAARIAAFMNAS
ncbi:bifunctional phosphopantothenoylcysteine decarboxylase/phosphopantothenate--cysteine ligase CoaBC [Granulibacter bethesdensis]|uniref:Coenzyme A biosynthesis bifunctional protein CoaBC n=1 Tax=Granulibacter bethesdensis (strain ATCC BAA-1260 / CGDNIH1) TaxID=391165 RepID=Q0BVU7_GRABC|nr:bifunctional phosphopantothenoylcysteine decarboxylase/phosphopantothenate--cysteine ligase CoaBC [Granulibacter bethesdensis]ABI61055.1 Phosphopantothenate--cysteine ligase [Granulibacter bethesdensis CGDNIH1]APH50829.1 Phosphopantothenate--cysteine ligase [Granulibacter bethesdensis]APH63523.1 Phosphopantothenate--cysteine ligase [Granulibacter bethesdensis]